eukprot:jgi/Mesvir1/20938/Mv08009-RA.1
MSSAGRRLPLSSQGIRAADDNAHATDSFWRLAVYMALGALTVALVLVIMPSSAKRSHPLRGDLETLRKPLPYKIPFDTGGASGSSTSSSSKSGVALKAGAGLNVKGSAGRGRLGPGAEQSRRRTQRVGDVGAGLAGHREEAGGEGGGEGEGEVEVEGEGYDEEDGSTLYTGTDARGTARRAATRIAGGSPTARRHAGSRAQHAKGMQGGAGVSSLHAQEQAPGLRQTMPQGTEGRPRHASHMEGELLGESLSRTVQPSGRQQQQPSLSSSAFSSSPLSSSPSPSSSSSSSSLPSSSQRLPSSSARLPRVLPAGTHPRHHVAASSTTNDAHQQNLQPRPQSAASAFFAGTRPAVPNPGQSAPQDRAESARGQPQSAATAAAIRAAMRSSALMSSQSGMPHAATPSAVMPSAAATSSRPARQRLPTSTSLVPAAAMSSASPNTFTSLPTNSPLGGGGTAGVGPGRPVPSAGSGGGARDVVATVVRPRAPVDTPPEGPLRRGLMQGGRCVCKGEKVDSACADEPGLNIVSLPLPRALREPALAYLPDIYSAPGLAMMPKGPQPRPKRIRGLLCFYQNCPGRPGSQAEEGKFGEGLGLGPEVEDMLRGPACWNACVRGGDAVMTSIPPQYRWNGRFFYQDGGGSGSPVFRVLTEDGHYGYAKFACVLGLDKKGNHLFWSNRKDRECANRVKGGGKVVTNSLAAQKIADECGLGDLSTPVSYQHMYSAIPEVNTVVDQDYLLTLEATGVALSMIMFMGTPANEVRQLMKKVNSTSIIRAALFDMLLSGYDRHPGNVFLTEEGDLALIDNDQSFEDPASGCPIDSLFIPGTRKNVVGRAHQYVALDLRCHADGGVIGKNYPLSLSRCLERFKKMSPVLVMDRYKLLNQKQGASVVNRATHMLELGFEKALQKSLESHKARYDALPDENLPKKGADMICYRPIFEPKCLNR